MIEMEKREQNQESYKSARGKKMENEKEIK